MIAYFTYIIACLITALSQMILKKEADNKKNSSFKIFNLTIGVLVAYVMLFASMVLSFYSMQTIPYREISILSILPYIFVLMLSWLYLKEKFTKRQLLGTIIIFIGIVVFSAG